MWHTHTNLFIRLGPLSISWMHIVRRLTERRKAIQRWNYHWIISMRYSIWTKSFILCACQIYMSGCEQALQFSGLDGVCVCVSPFTRHHRHKPTKVTLLLHGERYHTVRYVYWLKYVDENTTDKSSPYSHRTYCYYNKPLISFAFTWSEIIFGWIWWESSDANAQISIPAGNVSAWAKSWMGVSVV